MPGLIGPSDYSREPPRHPSLKINAKEPFNAEPTRQDLILSYITPVDYFYKRNHGPIPIVEDIDRYSLAIDGLVEKPIQLSMAQIRLLPKYNVTATLQCAGNRRTAMSQQLKVRGVGWDISALGNAVWGGAKLSDVLELVGVSKLTSVTSSGGKHVEFISIDKCKEEKGGPYKASVPLSQATNPEADVLLAYEMNGEILNRDHGYPLRVVVPGVIGARSVKWLDRITIIEQECQGFFMQKDYKMFPPSVNWDNIDWSTRRPQMDFPVQSAICSLHDVDIVKPGKVRIAGYAVSGGGRGIERVDVSIDGGKTWFEASRYQKTGVPYVSDDDSSCDKWAWVLFEAIVNLQSENADIVVKAVDSSANVQPENVMSIWNLRGILNTSWHHVYVRSTAAKL
ncbi:Sulfite oxidase [Rhynchospora pubera]|uniref:Sulfite oxidase n=1 Tax=Rhynchospora pubera TaxID=906938 RepID=A0AAV8EI37_9POAL|nr:Sulfite oxidase [Rhynchospora pubera]KAJ4778929.1 Sulfite oxidase [Rhynchospora pubera]KAJ4805363.1 Sulfite oxidase [Rhynchospora pubera]